MTASYAIQGTMSLSLKINDIPVPPAQNFIVEYSIYSGFGYKAPVLKIIFSDQQNILTGRMAINDGTVLTLVFGKRGFNKEVKFQIFSKKTHSIAVGDQITALALLYSPGYALGALSESYKGTSVDVLRELCGKAGFTFYSDETTKDKMTWLNIGKSRAQHVGEIVAHSYKADDAVMAMALDPFKNMYYRDLFKQLKKKPEYTIFSGATGESSTGPDKTFLATEFQPIAASGLLNALANYGTALIQPGLDGEIKTFDKVTPPVMGDGVPVNQEQHESFKYARMNYSQYYDPGIGDIGGSNAHEKYLSAPYTNNRMLALFSQCVRIMIDGEANIPMFEPVDLKVMRTIGTDTIVNEADSGVYIVGGFTIVGRGMYYTEVYDLYRCYVSESGNTPTLGSKNQKSSKGKPELAEGSESSVDYKDPNNTNAISRQKNNKVRSAGSPLDQFNAAQNSAKSELDRMVDRSTGQIDDLENTFKQESDVLGLGFLTSKYGSGVDTFNALMSEFAAAKSILENCGKLSLMEKLSFDFVMANIGPLIRALESRLSRVEGLGILIEAAINALIANGDIDASYLTSPSLATNCKQFKADHLNAAIADRFPDQCLDRFALDRLRLPSTRLNRLRRLLMNFLQNLLCVIGQG